MSLIFNCGLFFRPPASCYSPLGLHHLKAKADCCLVCHVLIYLFTGIYLDVDLNFFFSSMLVLFRCVSLSSFLLASSSGLLSSLMIASILFHLFMILLQHRHCKTTLDIFSLSVASIAAIWIRFSKVLSALLTVIFVYILLMKMPCKFCQEPSHTTASATSLW